MLTLCYVFNGHKPMFYNCLFSEDIVTGKPDYELSQYILERGVKDYDCSY